MSDLTDVPQVEHQKAMSREGRRFYGLVHAIADGGAGEIPVFGNQLRLDPDPSQRRQVGTNEGARQAALETEYLSAPQ